MASLIAADDAEAAPHEGGPEEAPIDALCFLGYPLHPPGKKDRAAPHRPLPRSSSLPALFVQGTRDPLCDLELLEAALPSYARAAPTVTLSCESTARTTRFNVT